MSRFEPWRELETLSNRLNRFFEGSWSKGPWFWPEGKEEFALADWSPTCDIEENNEEYVVHAELPGVKKDDINVSLENGMLLIEGKRRQEKEDKGKHFHRVERSYGTFMRRFALPTAVYEDKVMADYKDGMLTVHVPKNGAQTPTKKTVAVH